MHRRIHIHPVQTAGITVLNDGRTDPAKEITLEGGGFSYGDFNKAGMKIEIMMITIKLL